MTDSGEQRHETTPNAELGVLGRYGELVHFQNDPILLAAARILRAMRLLAPRIVCFQRIWTVKQPWLRVVDPLFDAVARARRG